MPNHDDILDDLPIGGNDDDSQDDFEDPSELKADASSEDDGYDGEVGAGAESEDPVGEDTGGDLEDEDDVDDAEETADDEDEPDLVDEEEVKATADPTPPLADRWEQFMASVSQGAQKAIYESGLSSVDSVASRSPEELKTLSPLFTDEVLDELQAWLVANGTSLAPNAPVPAVYRESQPHEAREVPTSRLIEKLHKKQAKMRTRK